MNIAYSLARRKLKLLTDDELFAVQLAVQLGQNPDQCEGYDKVRALFIATQGDGYPVAHDVIKSALNDEATERKADTGKQGVVNG